MFRQVVLINQGMEVAQIKEFTYMIMILLIEDRLYLSTYIVVSYATCDYFPYTLLSNSYQNISFVSMWFESPTKYENLL